MPVKGFYGVIAEVLAENRLLLNAEFEANP